MNLCIAAQIAQQSQVQVIYLSNVVHFIHGRVFQAQGNPVVEHDVGTCGSVIEGE